MRALYAGIDKHGYLAHPVSAVEHVCDESGNLVEVGGRLVVVFLFAEERDPYVAYILLVRVWLHRIGV